MIDHIDSMMAVMTAAFDPLYREAWNRRQVEDALSLGNCHYMLAGANGGPLLEHEEAAGFYLSRTGFEEEELLLIGVRPQFRRCGIGRFLLDHLGASASKRGVKRLLLEMRKGNPAQSLYTSYGFYQIGQRPDYYRTLDGQRIDAITFACDIG
jgi:ribosomal-protein-alanine N-acetyltransferase